MVNYRSIDGTAIVLILLDIAHTQNVQLHVPAASSVDPLTGGLLPAQALGTKMHPVGKHWVLLQVPVGWAISRLIKMKGVEQDKTSKLGVKT